MGRTKIIACLIALLLAPACSRGPKVVVASKNFTEQIVLGEIVAQTLEAAGLPVDRRFNLGGTLLAHQALVSGAIDVYPEYTGTALTAVLKHDAGASAEETYRIVRGEYKKRWKLTWLAPLGFENTFAMAIPGKLARDLNLKTLSDAARSGRRWKLGAGYEFVQRPDGLAGLSKAYGLRYEEPPATMDLGLLYAALDKGQIDMAAANSTDGLLAAMDLRVLEDDKHYFPPYECALVVRDAAFDALPKLRARLATLSGAFDVETIRKLNYAVDHDHRSIHEVAAQFLSARKGN